MNTTNLFVELIVIGVGGAIWFALIVFSIFGYEWVPTERLSLTIAAVPIISFVYLCGVITDRMADVIFNPLNLWMCKYSFGTPHSLRERCDELKKLRDLNPEERRNKCKNQVEQFYADRDLILNKSERFAALYEYGRSRQRIARGWSVNSVVLIIAFNVFIVSNLRGNSHWFLMALVGTGLLLLLAVLSISSWAILTSQQYQKLHFQAVFLRRL